MATSSLAETTIINIKTDRKLKHEAQGVSRELGLPLSTVINAYLRDFVREKRIIFSAPPVPNQKTRKLLDKIRAERKRGKKGEKADGPFTFNEAISYLDAS